MIHTITERVIADARKRGVNVVTRRQWGAEMDHMGVYSERRKVRPHEPLPADTLWCHITVTDNSVGITEAMRTLHRIGWERFESGVSYNFAVHMRSGWVGGGQALDAKGTHTLNDKNIPGYSHDQNAVSHAIAFIGMPGDKPTGKAIEAYAQLVASLIRQGALTKGHDFNPHSMVAFKDCPTDAVRAAMPTIHARALALI